MSHADALDALAGDPLIWRYRELCADDNPDAEQRDGYRGLVVRMATGQPARSVDAVLAEARAEGIPERIAQVRPCGGC
jgi:hypothetical protein